MDGMKWSGPLIDQVTSHGRLAEKGQPRTNEEIGLKDMEAERTRLEEVGSAIAHGKVRRPADVGSLFEFRGAAIGGRN